MGRHKMVKGICRMCGKNGNLSFEHVPPKVTLNRHTRYVSIPFDDYINAENVLKNPLKGKIRQGGVGYNSLCQTCNSFLGTNYVKAYDRWVRWGCEALLNVEFGYIKYKIIDVEPLKIIKQIISMFLSINDEEYLKSYPKLVLVCNEDRRDMRL